MKTIIAIALILVTLATAPADDRKRHETKRHESHNWIIERQQAGSVSGVPILDVAFVAVARSIFIADGSMFEKNNFIGYDKR